MSYLNKISPLVPSQLPGFVREEPDYANFVLFLQAYYEWMEQADITSANTSNTVVNASNQGIVYGSKNLINYSDIDGTLNEFIQYYMNEFMTFFPQEALVDPRRLVKTIKQLYQSKGTPASYEFLFRVIYNSDVNTYNTKDYILKASDGKWIATKYLTINSIDPTWQNAIGYTLFGTISKGYAVIENIVIYPTYIEVVLSNIQQNFQSGEFVTVVDSHFNPISFNGNPLTSQIFGLLNSVTVDPNYIGENYSVGDPVVFYGGLNPNVQNPVGANGFISQVSGATVLSVTPVYEGQGYRPGGYSTISFNSPIANANGALAVVSTFDTANYYPVYLVATDLIGNKANVHLSDANFGFANLASANINTILSDALTVPVINTYGIATVTVTSGGLNYDSTTTATAIGTYATEADANGVSVLQPFPSLGILAPIQIINGGLNYNTYDTIVFSGGLGHGAQANITSVNVTTGAITSITYVANTTPGQSWPLGGLGYTGGYIPTVSVTSATGSGANLIIPGLVGSDATFKIKETPSGQVIQITVDNKGKDYISAPGVSLRVEDVLVTNVDQFNQPKQGDKIYQGNILNPTFVANVDSFIIYSANTSNTYSSTFKLRAYDYSGIIDTGSYIKISRNNVDVGANISVNVVTDGFYTNGRRIYGNGAAKAQASFLNGIVLGAGNFQNADGQPSGYSVLQNQEYNEYTYILQVQEALAKYKDTALKFLHPAGMNYFAVDVLKNSANFNLLVTTEELDTQNLGYLLGVAFTANVAANSNVINFSNLSGANVANAVFANTYLTYNTGYGTSFYSKVTGATNNTITLADTWITQVANVAVGSISANSTTINISNLTKAWSIATGNNFTYLSDIVHIYDQVSFDGSTYKTVVHVDQGNVGNTLIVNTAFDAANTISGYITLSKNTYSTSINVSGIVIVPETIDITTESGQPLTTEDGRILILG